mgnify:CR=1 FL=1|jgi:hypothetical protein
MIKLFKQKEIEVTNKEEFEKTLTRLIELLRDNAFSAQADAVRRVLAALLNSDTDKFLKTINSVDMWGGSGAVWEVYGFQTKEDEKEFWSQIIRLTDLMKEINIKNNHAYSTAKIFKTELNK